MGETLWDGDMVDEDVLEETSYQRQETRRRREENRKSAITYALLTLENSISPADPDEVLRYAQAYVTFIES